MATTNVEGLFGSKGILLAVDDDHTVALTAVDNAQLAVIKEILVLDAWIDIETEVAEVLELQGLVDRHSATKNKAVVVRIGEIDLVGYHHLLHDEALAQRLCVVVLHVLRVTSRLEVHSLLAEAIGHCSHKQ